MTDQKVLYAYLTILTGNRAGTNFPLDPARIGHRPGDGLPHFDSRSDLVARARGGGLAEDHWSIRDSASRNGTSVNGQKIDEARLTDGNTIRIGSTEFAFHESEEPPTAKGDDPQVMQTIVQDLPIAVQQSHEEALAGLPSAEQVKELMLLYQLCIKLMGSGDPNRVVEIALELLKKRTGAAVVGYLAVNDEGGLQPKLVIPQEAARRVTLNQSLTELVSRQGHAVWIANQTTGKDATDKGSHNLGHFADGVWRHWCGEPSRASDRRSARSTCICNRGGSGNRTSISSSRWRTWWHRWCRRGSSRRCKRTFSNWSKSRPAIRS